MHDGVETLVRGTARKTPYMQIEVRAVIHWQKRQAAAAFLFPFLRFLAEPLTFPSLQ